MRVIHVITRLIVGGAQENTIASVLGLRQNPDLQVDLISGPTRGAEGSLEPLCANLPGLLTVVPELVRPIHPWLDVLAMRKLIGHFRARGPDIIHTHSGKAGFLGRLAAARSGVPIIIHTIHGPSFGNFQGALANTVFRTAERYAGKFTTHFVVVANAMKEQYLAAGIGRPDQYSRIFSGFNVDAFRKARNDPALRGRMGLRPEDIVIGTIARLFKLKGHEDLLALAPGLSRECPEIRFLLVGDGPWRARLEGQAKALGLEKRVVFTGLVAPEQIADYVGIMDVLVHLSAREGLPRALPQAMAAGRPVVSYDSDGAKEVCLDGETGFLLRPGDRTGLSERLRRLAGDPGLRQRLGEQGQKFVQERFGVEVMIRELRELYARLQARRGIKPAG